MLIQFVKAMLYLLLFWLCFIIIVILLFCFIIIVICFIIIVMFIIFVLVVTCPKPDNPVNGNASVQGSLEFGTRVLYTCKNEYVLSNDGLKIGTCNENGTWGVAPTCIGKNGYLFTYSVLYMYVIYS